MATVPRVTHVTLPPALAAEREALLATCLERLRAEGFGGFAVLDYADFLPPTPVVIPVLNVHAVPDISATGRQALVACVELSSDLDDIDVGRRWQALQGWAVAARAQIRIYVPATDVARACDIARHWHLEPDLVRGIARPH